MPWVLYNPVTATLLEGVRHLLKQFRCDYRIYQVQNSSWPVRKSDLPSTLQKTNQSSVMAKYRFVKWQSTFKPTHLDRSLNVLSCPLVLDRICILILKPPNWGIFQLKWEAVGHTHKSTLNASVGLVFIAPVIPTQTRQYNLLKSFITFRCLTLGQHIILGKRTWLWV